MTRPPLDELRALVAGGDTLGNMSAAYAALPALLAYIAELERDAERYRWLRGDAPTHSERWSRWNLQRWDGKSWHSLEQAELDAAIDSARGAGGG